MAQGGIASPSGAASTTPFAPQQQQSEGSPINSTNSTTRQDVMGRGGSSMPFGQALGQLGFGGYGPRQRMQNPFQQQQQFFQQQPQQPSFLQDPEYQGYQTQAQDLNRQMQEYMQKAPMYQQLQDIQGKMSGYQDRYRQQQMQQAQQPMQQMQQYQQPMGLQGLMALLGGRDGYRQPSMSMDMPQAYYYKNGGEV